MRLGIAALLVCLSLSPLAAQDEAVPPAEDWPAALAELSAAIEPVPPFPLIPLLEAAFAGEVSWRPDWPREIPPDAFAVKGNALLITLDTRAGEYRYSRDGEGRPMEFPLLIGGALVQAEALREPDGAIGQMRLDGGGGENEPWVVEFSEPLLSGSAFPGPNMPPVLVSRGETVYKILLQEAEREISETWYDSDGGFVGYYRVLIDRTGLDWRILSIESHSEGDMGAHKYYFESGGNISEVSSPQGSFSALYGARKLPLYWTQPLPYALQWDEQGFLVRMRDDAAASEGADYRYEYELDERLNWIERWETGMESRFGILAPGPIQYIRRQIIYGTGE